MTEDGLEKDDVTLVSKLEVTLLVTPDVTLGVTKEVTLTVILNVRKDITLTDVVCDFWMEDNTDSEIRLERNGVILV